MSNRPDEGAAGSGSSGGSGGSGGEQRYGQQTARPDVPTQPGAPAGPSPMQGPPAQGSPAQGSPAQGPPMQQGQPTWQQQQAPTGAGPVGTGPMGAGPMGAGPMGAGPTGPTRLGPPMMITEAETQVVGRRIVQYIVDYILAGIVPAIAYWLFDRGSGSLHAVGWLLATVIALAAYFIYWVSIPYAYGGQTFGMKLLRLRVISKDGVKASMMQLFIRGIFLIVDTFIFGLVGLITMVSSRYRQRVGDHVAGTIVVSAEYGPQI